MFSLYMLRDFDALGHSFCLYFIPEQLPSSSSPYIEVFCRFGLLIHLREPIANIYNSFSRASNRLLSLFYGCVCGTLAEI